MQNRIYCERTFAIDFVFYDEYDVMYEHKNCKHGIHIMKFVQPFGFYVIRL